MNKATPSDASITPHSSMIIENTPMYKPDGKNYLGMSREWYMKCMRCSHMMTIPLAQLLPKSQYKKTDCQYKNGYSITTCPTCRAPESPQNTTITVAKKVCAIVRRSRIICRREKMQWLAIPSSDFVITVVTELSIHLPSVICSTCCIVVVGGVTDVKLPDAPRHILSRPRGGLLQRRTEAVDSDQGRNDSTRGCVSSDFTGFVRLIAYSL
jgi:hypothetical protein